jgi:probable F420-dependent oxidoreductase
MAWPDSVVGKLREQIGAIRALWHTWQSGEKLNFRGEYYRLTLMSPFFNPGPIEYPNIPIYIAGVNTGLARLAGEVSDGFLVHPFHSTSYLEEVLLPAITEGARKSGRSRGDIMVSATVFVASSPEDEDFVRAQISFYASTPSYRSVMALHGWEDTAEQLSSLALRGKWSEMPDQIDDDMLSRFAIISNTESLASTLLDRYRGLADRINLYMPFIPRKDDEFWKSLLRDFERKSYSS